MGEDLAPSVVAQTTESRALLGSQSPQPHLKTVLSTVHVGEPARTELRTFQLGGPNISLVGPRHSISPTILCSVESGLLLTGRRASIPTNHALRRPTTPVKYIAEVTITSPTAPEIPASNHGDTPLSADLFATCDASSSTSEFTSDERMTLSSTSIPSNADFSERTVAASRVASRAAPRLAVPSSATLPVTSSRTSGALVGESFDPLAAVLTPETALHRGVVTGRVRA